MLIASLPQLVDLLDSARVPHQSLEMTSFSNEAQKSLGGVRLKIIECLYLMFKLRKADMNEALSQSQALTKISQLVIDYPWNNFLQLKVINIYETIMDDHTLKLE